MQYLASTITGRDEYGGATGVIFSIRSGRDASLLRRNASCDSLMFLLRALLACSSLNSGSIRTVFMANSGPVIWLTRNRMKFVRYGKLRSSQFTCGGKGSRYLLFSKHQLGVRWNT